MKTSNPLLNKKHKRTILEVSSSLKEEQERRGTVRILGAFIVLITSAIIAYTAAQAITQSRTDTIKSLRSRANILLQSRTELMDIWLHSNITATERITKADLFRLFATEVSQSGGIENVKNFSDNSDNPDPLSLQIPYLNRVLSDFVTTTDFYYAGLYDDKGNRISYSDPGRMLSNVDEKLIKETVEKKRFLFSPIRHDEDKNTLVVESYIPIFSPQVQSEREEQPVGVFIFTIPVKEKLASFLTIDATASLPGQLRLFQKSKQHEGYNEVIVSAQRLIENPKLEVALARHNIFEFSRTTSLSGDKEVYTIAKPLQQNSWFLLWEVSVHTALSEVKHKENNILMISILAILFIASAFTTFWWYGRNRYNRRVAKIYENLAHKVETQKWLLDSINNAVSEAIGLKGADGRYLYVNPSFGKMVARDSEEIPGHQDRTLFGEVTATKFQKWDQVVLRSGEPVTVNEEIFLGKRKHYLEISKAPLNNDDLAENAIVTIIRDNTDLVEAEIARRRAHERTIMALAKTIETRDPHLSGHSKRVSAIAALIAEEMALDKSVITTVEMAGHLSQVGKVAIPRAILTKESRLNDDEIKVMQTHIDHASNILRQVDFELPVHETVYQMYERMDGGGYPRGLRGDQISLEARILGIADYFCARIEPRSYRSAISPDEAIRILASMPDRYDQDVIAALRAVTNNPEVQRILNPKI